MKKLKIVIIAIASVCFVAAATLFLLLRVNKLSNTSEEVIFIPSQATYDDIVDSLTTHHCIGNTAIFNTLSRLRGYRNHVKGGCYKLQPHMPTWNALTKLYRGNQDPIRLTINKHRTVGSLCRYIGSRLEVDSSTLAAMLADDSICASYGYNTSTVIGMFVQNTYDVYWNTSASRLLDRMDKESRRFWNDKRLKQCQQLGLTKDQVITLASIVEEETNKNDEKADIASVYLNRLRKGMLLQADPTLKYAVGDFTLRRILNKHMDTDSPYNTYKHTGLPPGPICIPSAASIGAVLENKQTEYLYFCAKADFSGRHTFATTLKQHNANAAAFHSEMNRRKIYK